jgi:hypothetical protein
MTEALTAAMNKVAIEQSKCFDEETLVLTPGGSREIQHIDVGDLVLSRCEKTGRQGYRRVTKKYERECEEQCDIIYGSKESKGWGSGVRTTAEHPFWVDGVGWVPAGDLQVGQKVLLVDPNEIPEKFRPEDQKLARLVESGKLHPVEIVETSRRCTAWPYGEDIYKVPVYNIEVEEFNTYFVDYCGVWVHNCGPFDQGKPQKLRKVTDEARLKGELEVIKDNTSDADKRSLMAQNEALQTLSKYVVEVAR